MYKKLDPGKIRDFLFVADIDDVLPHGEIRYWDTDGHNLSEFSGLAIGSSVAVKVTGEDEDEGKEVTFPEMMIGDLKLFDAADQSAWSGDLVIDFVHPWRFLLDPTPHAYEAMNNSELIKKVLSDQARGRDFPCPDENFSKTDDNGTYPRYKSGETDFSFIMEKVLPYCAVEQIPTHFFCDEHGDFWLKSFKELYKENPKIIIGPEPNRLPEKSVSDQIAKSKEANGIDDGLVYSAGKVMLQIGAQEMIPELYPSFITENANSGGTAAAKKKAGNMLKKNTDGKTFGAYFPISNMMMAQSAGTSMKVVMNRSLVDGFMLMFAGSSKIDSMFRIAVSLPFVGDVLHIGETIDLILPWVEYQEEGEMKAVGAYVHWLTGKWLVTRAEHSLMTGQAAKFTTTLYLARPTFVGSESTTSLINMPMLMEVPG
jgi:hypothetical protein